MLLQHIKKNSGNALINNAKIHRYNLYILIIDIKNFFPSIRKNKVYNLFRKIGYNGLISEILSNICTYKGYLPQGGVTSPYLSNLICYKLDKRISGYCNKRDINYSRYADDLVFSANNKNELKKAFNVIKDIIEDEGFKLNDNKTRYLVPKSRKRITGITVNDGNLKAPKELKRKVRAMTHRSIVLADYSKIEKIRGYVSFINSIENGYYDKIINYINNFQKKDIVYFKEIVDAFNSNKIFKDVDKLILEDINEDEVLTKYGAQDAYLESIYHERETFKELIKKFGKSVNNTIKDIEVAVSEESLHDLF
ncbi:reverse transcriptase domain-containing protein [Caloranaerobacter sp. DY30410]|uniref:reverse transcriptase domain-containing protein n=1 Tax=Caloranaerobacter sp. DY30410 TaxID=3238305 RepID=UPI003D05A330